jgi:Xaa-Pro aminopeptidase
MKFKGNDAILITKLENVFYLTNFSGSNGQVVLLKNGWRKNIV